LIAQSLAVGFCTGLIGVDCEQNCVCVDAKAAVDYWQDAQKDVIHWAIQTHQLFD
jgi:hypothetical protein